MEKVSSRQAQYMEKVPSKQVAAAAAHVMIL